MIYNSNTYLDQLKVIDPSNLLFTYFSNGVPVDTFEGSVDCLRYNTNQPFEALNVSMAYE